MNKILLNAGESGRGWSYIETFLQCPRRFFWKEQFKDSFRTTEEPLVRGSIGHIGLAHLYARQRAVQQGRDPNEYYPCTAAMERCADDFGELGTPMLAVALRVVKGYVAYYGGENFPVIGVERKVETNFRGYSYTARIDLEIEDRAGKVWIVDHKIVSRLEGKVYRRYVLSGQFLGLHHIGVQTYGDRFGGIRLNILGVNPMKFERISPEPAPWMLMRFPDVVARAYEGIARVREELRRDPEYVIPATPSEHTCWPYNRPCPFFELCRWGTSLPISLPTDPEEVDNGEKSG